MAGFFETITRLLGFGSDNYGEASGNYSKSEKSIETASLVDRVYHGGYIQNLRIGRSWILPQLVGMAFDNCGNFSEDRYYKAVSELSYDSGWTVLLRNYKALAVIVDKDPKGFDERSRWWTKNVALAVVRNDYQLLRKAIESGRFNIDNCKGGVYVYLPGLRGCADKYGKMFFLKTPSADFTNNYKSENETISDLYDRFEKRISTVEDANTPQALYNALSDYNGHRCSDIVTTMASFPDEFISAYAGDGAYSAMMTMVKYLNLTPCGAMMTREQSIAEVERQAKAPGTDGRKLLTYCGQKFFDKKSGGTFDYRRYVDKEY